ncbi:glycerol kinase GlpK [Candidatus Pelagibacter ubique]|nr:glycerol kinase GlpK [Candidatus Pelagibacter ubique]
MKKFIISIDQGTTSSRAILFDLKGKPIFTSQTEFTQYFPKDGWVEHDPEEIWKTTLKVFKEVIKKSKKLKGKVLTIGITNQRETTILWDKKTGKPVYNAIVWQDRRSSEYCKKLIKQKKETIIYNKTGLLIDAYFSATKIRWIIDNVPKARDLIKKKRLLFGTVDSFLLWKLTKGVDHATDATNASRTMLFNISTNKWDDQILKILKIPKEILPVVKDCAADFGYTDPSITGTSYPITGMVGDQQSAAIGQCCFEPGSVKSTYGTGAFLLLNTGSKKVYSKNRLLTTIGYRINGKTTYALEGTIFIAGAGVQWLRDKIKFIKKASDTENKEISKKEIQYLIRSVNNYLEKQISTKDIVDSYSGIRPLIEDFNQASKVTRDYIFDLNIIKKLPLLSIYGGKLTTYRKLAENVLLDLEKFLPKTKMGPWTHKKNLF